MKNGIRSKIESCFLILFTTLGKIVPCKNPAHGGLLHAQGDAFTKEQNQTSFG
ncbi:hypothetical protein HMPREF9163_01431 [Selenomonas sp. oral taxon 138 str. F0429]|nr:hypothetical protein HMPREF9163_01431 [Selenomonas sp. oral taxon 138 str. F0429]